MSDWIQDARPLEDWLIEMKRDWDDRARRDAKWFINPLRFLQSDAEFDESGSSAVQTLVIDDLDLLAAGRDPSTLRVLELGCGIGRMTRFLAQNFAEVHATDVSPEMIRQARERLAAFNNVTLYETNGYDLAALPSDSFDFVFSAFVFQHVPSVQIICANLREAYRVLKDGGFLKFQTNSLTAFDFEEVEKDTWMGASLPETDIRTFAEEVGAQVLSLDGSGSQSCWTILRKRDVSEVRDAAPAHPQITFFGQTSRPANKKIPINGDNNSLTLLVSGLAGGRVDCNSLLVEISGLKIWPHYVGPPRKQFESIIPSEGSEGGAQPTRVDVSLPVGAPTGSAEVRIRLTSGEVSPTVPVEFVLPQPVIPRIDVVSNAFDGRGDVHARGQKSLLRLHVEGLDETADSGNIRVQIGHHILKPSHVALAYDKGLHHVDAQLPVNIASGPTEVRLYFGNIGSSPITVEVIDTDGSS